MEPRLDTLRHALRALPDETLVALRHAAIAHGTLSPAFTAWVKHIVDWEQDHRAGCHYYMLCPEELVHPREFARGARRALAKIAAVLAANATPVTDELLDSLAQLVSRCEA